MKLKKLLRQDELPSIAGNPVRWADTPEAFRMAIHPAQAIKLARVADSLTLYVSDLAGHVTPQKGSLITLLSKLHKDALIACTFNGLDLLVLCVIDRGEEDAD